MTLSLLMMIGCACVGLALWFPCCWCAECEYCTKDADTVAVTFTGFESGQCPCDWLNATFILPRDESATWFPCGWKLTGTEVCDYYGVNIDWEIYAIVNSTGTVAVWDVYLFLTVAGYCITITSWKWESTTSRIDCTATRDVPFYDYNFWYGSPNPACFPCSNHENTTCQVN